MLFNQAKDVIEKSFRLGLLSKAARTGNVEIWTIVEGMLEDAGEGILSEVPQRCSV